MSTGLNFDFNEIDKNNDGSISKKEWNDYIDKVVEDVIDDVKDAKKEKKIEVKPVRYYKCMKPLTKDHRVINGEIKEIPDNVSCYIYGKF